MEQVHEIEQRLAHHLQQSEGGEIHDFGFVLFELGEPAIEFWPGVKLNAQGVRLPRLKLEARQPHGAFHPGHLLAVASFRVDAFGPDLPDLGVQRRHDRGEELIAHRRPISVRKVLLVNRPRRALTDAEKASSSFK
jgi:hypothetical protein